jgi:hypothetical protein
VKKREKLIVGVLVDNGSLNAHAPLLTRKLAKELSESLGFSVIAASLAHSDKIPIGKTQGVAVPLLEPLLESLSVDTNPPQTVLVVPLLLVTGGAIYQKIAAVIQQCIRPPHNILLAPALIDLSSGQAEEIGDWLSESIVEFLETNQTANARVCIVDHGSPVKISADSRNLVAQSVGTKLEGRVSSVQPCSMESRDGQFYHFNQPLYENVLRQHAAEHPQERLIAVRLFLQPGRHSGKRGDLDVIEAEVRDEFPELRVATLKPMQDQKKLKQLLYRRYIELCNTNEAAMQFLPFSHMPYGTKSHICNGQT